MTRLDDERSDRHSSVGTVMPHESDLDARLLDLEADEEPQFLRAPKRVPVRRGPLQKKTVNRLRTVLLVGFSIAAIGLMGAGLFLYGSRSWRFRIESSDNVETQGLQKVTRAQLMEIFGADIGRNIFFVPLADRKKQLEQVAWIESATVMRLLPNRIGVSITERTPVAFARIGSHVQLIDAGGALMEMPPRGQSKYRFPVIVGMGEMEPLSTRAARMKIFHRLMQELDSDKGLYSRDISEVDLSDPEDVKILVADPAGAVLVHLGSTAFLQRYKVYIAHVQEWKQQFSKLESVDLRYDRQIIVNPDTRPTSNSKH